MTVPIERYALEMANQRGAGYQEAWRKAKWYINNTPAGVLIDEFKRIEDPRAFSYLFAIGLPNYLQDVATARWHELRRQSERG
jgi:hypothetical protein